MSLKNQNRIQPGERIVLLHYGELALKGGNRGRFEQKLLNNIREQLDGYDVKEILRLRGRMIVRAGSDPSSIVHTLQNIPGIVNVSPGIAVETDKDSIFEEGVNVAKEASFSTFAVRARRAYKEFPLNSEEINEKLGEKVLRQSGAEVDLDHPDFTLRVELLQNRTFIYGQKYDAVGGLPVGISGTVLSLLSGGIDSPVASYLMMKRGCRSHFVHFHNFPLTNRAGQEKAEELVRFLNQFQHTSTLYLVPFADCQKKIVSECPSSLRILLYRRFMVRIADRIARTLSCQSLITGENLGQVSSQTLTNLGNIERVSTLPVLRPLVGYDKQEIIDLAKQIGTYETSIEPHQDCCSYFMPDHPATSSTSYELKEAEEALPVQELVEETVDAVETREIEAIRRKQK